jgi:hypothetical protein
VAVMMMMVHAVPEFLHDLPNMARNLSLSSDQDVQAECHPGNTVKDG